ncbi:hypothetical protein O181_020539 [Austropuccinia psidii MF-1]|uniref:Uncharacterized protein n=1 Tax=Austropuccinia psidii MF-1 TaxID=1389203 RepID=A0A9Q3C946_9BASI|nr:hypothetical protein [Austropuccinia psidii MF-1]
MSSTHSETNGEPKREDFMVHEQGTCSNSELTHPQIPLSKSRLNQFKMQQQGNKAFKSHNVADCASQKEPKRWLKEENPDNVHGRRGAVNSHFLFLLKMKDKHFSSLPAPPSTE